MFVPDYDHHGDMLEELKIEDNQRNAESKFIRAELLPPNGDMFSEIDVWQFKIDQDITPDWYAPEYDRERFIEAIKEWAKDHIITDKSDFTIKCGTYYLKNCKGEAYGSATVKAYGSATVKAYGSATVKAYGSATVVIPESSRAERGSVVLMENSTLKDCNTKIIYQVGNWKFVAEKSLTE